MTASPHRPEVRLGTRPIVRYKIGRSGRVRNGTPDWPALVIEVRGPDALLNFTSLSIEDFADNWERGYVSFDIQQARRILNALPAAIARAERFDEARRSPRATHSRRSANANPESSQ